MAAKPHVPRARSIQRNPSLQRTGGILGGVIILLVVIAAVGGGVYYYYQNGNSEDQNRNLITHTAFRGSFDHIVLEQGEIESSRNTELICNVKSRTGGSGIAILWVADEGTPVKKGDKLVELDSSQLEQELKQQRIVVGNADANVATGEAAVKQAMIARQEYLEGVFMTDEKAIESEIAIAQQELRKAQLALDSSERLVAKGLVKSLQLEADQYAVANARNQLEANQGRLKVLQNLTRQKMLVQFDSDIAAARAGLEAYRGTQEEETEKLEEIREQITACVMYAPTDGVVVHANKYSSRGGNAEVVIEPGAIIRERQAIIRLPDPSEMQVSAKINESRVTLLEEGMPARIRVDAIPGLQLQGRVTKVNRYAEPGSWMSSSIKEYGTTIKIIDPPPSIRTGMTAEVQIFVQQLDDALQIPIQGVYEYRGNTLALMRGSNGELETRNVTVVATNDKMATISDGITEGEDVVLNLRDHLDLVNLPEVAAIDNSDMAALRQAPGAKTADADGPSNAGPPSGGPPSSAADIVNRTFESNDTDGDGILSKEEIAAMDGNRRDRIAEADTDGDGAITRAEMTVAAGKMMAAMRARQSGGGGPGGGPPGGGRGRGGS
ncbi:Macrolide export protein MacA [Roseimaritima multifibrata]|uniref:Macrolide export protein MacA n=1 Tax=Roseimaritima multifibrata TaxID=1930274 RepID=A0A517M9R7_9BACT|nr:efflux RND transporter periplasmic adaptor subunit [Roseimaritima multifibrata]QDS91633.1 Macrolide export protein MacA [Roseimaritima multifibrata]